MVTRRRGSATSARNGGAADQTLALHDYPWGDGKPMAETAIHRDAMIALILMLKTFFARRPDVYVSGNMMLYYEPGNRFASVAPDVFVTLGVAKLPERRVYFTWVEGRPPSVVIEVTSRSTRRQDMVRKRDLYAAIGVAEYYLFDPLAEYLRPPLQGFRLLDGAYQPIPPSPADGSLSSEQLGLLLVIVNGQLRLFDEATREFVPTPEERALAAERGQVEAERRQAAAQRGQVEAERRESEQRRRADELERQLAREREQSGELATRLAELERRLRGGRDPA